MPDLVNVTYAQTGQSKSTNAYGMRDMQERALVSVFICGFCF